MRSKFSILFVILTMLHSSISIASDEADPPKQEQPELPASPGTIDLDRLILLSYLADGHQKIGDSGVGDEGGDDESNVVPPTENVGNIPHSPPLSRMFQPRAAIPLSPPLSRMTQGRPIPLSPPLSRMTRGRPIPHSPPLTRMMTQQQAEEDPVADTELEIQRVQRANRSSFGARILRILRRIPLVQRMPGVTDANSGNLQ